MSKTLFLAHISLKPKDILEKVRGTGQNARWIFFCEDYREYLSWKKSFPDSIPKIKIYGEIQKKADKLRDLFDKKLSEIGEDKKSLGVMAFRIAERNNAVIPLFLNICYIHILKDQMLNSDINICVLSDNWELLETIEKNFKNIGWKSIVIRRQKKISGFIKHFLRISKRLLLFFIKALLSYLGGYKIAGKKLKEKAVLLFTYVDSKTFRRDGVFKDKYFPGLGDWLQKSGWNAVTLPVLFNTALSQYFSSWKWFRKNGYMILNPFRYYKISDYLFALKESWNQKNAIRKEIVFEDLDLSVLFKNEAVKSLFSNLESLLYFYLPKRLFENGIQFNRVITEYEGMVNEKLVIAGFREHAPETKVIGFQHGALYPNLICNYPNKYEDKYFPKHDYVISNSEYFRGILIEKGLEKKEVVAGASLRYVHLWKELESNERKSERFEYDIFVPLPLMHSDLIELFYKLFLAFKDLKDVRICLKPHTMTSISQVNEILGNVKMPSNFKIVENDFNKLMEKSKLLVTLSSSSLFDAFAKGMPLLIVGRDSSIELNPLAFFDEFKNKVFYEPEEIREEAQKLLSLSAKELSEYKKKGREVLIKSFTPVTDDALRVFIQ